MKGKEIAELISTAYETKNPNNAIALFNLLCDQIDFPHFAEYERGYTVGKDGRAIEDDISEFVKAVEQKLKGTEALDEFYENLEDCFLCYIDDDIIKLKKFFEEGIFMTGSIVKSIKSDELKTQIIKSALKNGEINYAYIDVLATINNDDLKEQVLSQIEEPSLRRALICSFSSDELKEKYIGNVSKADRLKVIISFESDELKLEYAKTVNRDKLQAILISLKSDELKLKNMNGIDIVVAQTISSDDVKLNWLLNNREKLSNKEVFRILFSLKDDNKRLQCIDLLEDRTSKIELLNRAKRPDLELLMHTCNKLGINIFDELINSNNGIYPENYIRKWQEIGIPKDMSFGIEIEAAGEYAFLYTQFPHICKRWDMTNESLNRKYVEEENIYLVEASSPILSDCDADIQDICRVCTLLKNGGLEVEDNCGGHVHIGANYLTTKESYQRLIELWCNCEKIIFEICDEPYSVKRFTYDDYATPISGILKEGEIEDKQNLNKDEFIAQLQSIQGDRYKSINFANVGKEVSTIEFRIPNGSLDPNVWIENIRLFGRMMQTAEELGKLDNRETKEYTREERRNLWLATILTNANVPEEDKAKFLINLLFDEEEYKQIYFEGYNTNKGQFQYENDKFSIIDFKNLYREMNYIQKSKERRGRENGTKDEDSFDRG